uniref:VPS33B late endosome and lysosome associated n=1 Tax=Petromyzon marinus TaxID=7757 RepID=S4RFL9_PETMA
MFSLSHLFQCPSFPMSDFPGRSIFRFVRSFFFLLFQLPGRKDLFIEQDLMSPLDRITGLSVLKKHEVDKIYKMDGKHVSGGCDQRCFLIRPREITVKSVADSINADKAAGVLRKYKIIFTPRKLYSCETVLEMEGVFGASDVSCEQWEFDLLPLDNDVITLELPDFFQDFFMDGNQSMLFTVAKSIHKLQSLFGPVRNVYGIGRAAKMVYELMELLSNEANVRRSSTTNSEMGDLFLIDRDVDLITPLCSQVTFEGLLDDIFGIKCGSVEFGPEVTGTEKKLKILLNSQDKVFREIRNQHFSNVFGLLSSKAKVLQTNYDKRHDMNIQNMKEFVANELRALKQEHRSLSLYIGSCEAIMKRKTKSDFKELLKTEHSLLEGIAIRECISSIEEAINRQSPILDVLRLLCLLSVTEGGLVANDMRSLKTQFLHSYGTEQLLTLNNLRKAGLLTEQQTPETVTTMESKVGKLVSDKPSGKLTDAFTALQRKSHFRALSKKLNLLSLLARQDSRSRKRLRPAQPAGHGGAYMPLSCRIVEQVLDREGWNGLEEIARLLNGNEFSSLKLGQAEAPGLSRAKLVLVFFLGGCTYSEIAALRFLGRTKGYNFVVLTTSIINSTRLLESLVEA